MNIILSATLYNETFTVSDKSLEFLISKKPLSCQNDSQKFKCNQETEKVEGEEDEAFVAILSFCTEKVWIHEMTQKPIAGACNHLPLLPVTSRSLSTFYRKSDRILCLALWTLKVLPRLLLVFASSFWACRSSENTPVNLSKNRGKMLTSTSRLAHSKVCVNKTWTQRRYNPLNKFSRTVTEDDSQSGSQAMRMSGRWRLGEGSGWRLGEGEGKWWRLGEGWDEGWREVGGWWKLSYVFRRTEYWAVKILWNGSGEDEGMMSDCRTKWGGGDRWRVKRWRVKVRWRNNTYLLFSDCHGN